MLCRALLAAVVLSYVLCVLLLSGVQKEDIDAGTLRKLQRHNVNIDDINDQQLQKQCLGKTTVPVTLSSTQLNPVTETPNKLRPANEIPTDESTEDVAQLEKIVKYLEYKRKKEKDKMSTHEPTRPSTSSTSDLADRAKNTNFEDTNSGMMLREMSDSGKNDITDNNVKINKKLENFMNIWKTDINDQSVTTQESATVNLIQEDSKLKNQKDVEYIAKIVEEIMSKRLINIAKNTTVDSNDNYRQADNVTNRHYKNMMMQPANYFLQNCKLGNFYVGFENELQRAVNDPDTNTKYNENICKRIDQKEKKILTGQIQDSAVYNILSKLKKEESRENQLRNRAINPRYTNVKTNNNYNKEPNALGESVSGFKNLSQTSISNKQNKPSKNRNAYNILDFESAKALETALETQSNIVKQLFNRQRNLVTNDKQIIRIFDNENRNNIISAVLPTTVSYNPSNQDNDQVDKYYKNWQFRVPRPLEKQQETMQQGVKGVLNNNNGYSNKEKSTQIRLQYDDEQGQQYKHPWFYREAGNEQLTTKKKEISTGFLFEPSDDRKINNVGPTLKNTNGKKWSPYFDTAEKSSRIIPTDELDTPKQQESSLANSLRLVQSRGEISRERVDKKLSHFNELYPNKNEPPNYGKYYSTEQIETKPKLCQVTQEIRVECLSDDEYKSNWAYFKNRQYMEQKPNTEEPIEEKEYFNYRFPTKPRSPNHLDTDTTKDRFAVKHTPDENEIYNKNDTKDLAKIAAFPPNVIKDIANSIKEIVFKDLTTTTVMPPATTTSVTTTKLTTPTTLSTTTTTLSTTTTTTSTTPQPTTMTYTTNQPTEGATKPEENPLKIQDASKALEKIMEMFEQINKIKSNKGKNVDVKDTVDFSPYTKTEVTTDVTIIRHQQMNVQQTAENVANVPRAENHFAYNQQLLQFEPPKTVSFQQQPLKYPQPGQIKQESLMPYFPLTSQLMAENNLPYDPRTFQSNPENRTPFFPPVLQQRPENKRKPQAVQIKAENSLPYELSTFQSNSNRSPYFQPPVRPEPENPYILQAALGTKENQTIYVPPAVQEKTANNLPYNPQALQSNLESHTPYFPSAIEMRAENRISYTQPIVQIQTGKQLPQDPDKLKRGLVNNLPYFPEGRAFKAENRVPYNPQAIHSNPESRVPYNQQSLQSRLGNQMPYDPRTLQNNPESNVPSDAHSLQMNTGIHYDPNTLQSNPNNKVPYIPQSIPYVQSAEQLQTDIRETYDARTLHNNPGNTHNVKPKFYNSKIQLDPYSEKEVIHPFKPKPKPRKHAITVQTNSGEIAPLKIELRKPIVQTVVLTTKSPEKIVPRSSESFENEKPWKKDSSPQYQINKLKTNQYAPRHSHKDAYIQHPKSRKTKKDPEITQRHKPRFLQDIDRFHEKLERQDTWSPQHEKEKIAKRMQRPIVKNNNYDDTHFRNFLQTQQKVNAMLERILSSAKNKQISSEVV